MTIYQVFCGRHEEANRRDHVGQVLTKMEAWPWQRIRQAGFDTVYLLGLFNHQGPLLVSQEEGRQIGPDEDRETSVFAMSDHHQIDPTLGDETAARHLIQRIRQAGLRVMADLVVNQTSTVHDWVKTHPEYYQWSSEKMVGAFSQDVWLLNHERPEIEAYFVSLLEWLADLSITAVRCDMAHLAPTTWWARLIQKTKAAHPDLQFVAEAYSESVFNWQPLDDLLQAGFEAVYHEFFYRNLKQFYEQGQDLTNMTKHITYVLQSGRCQTLVHYLSNHDDGPLEPKGQTTEAWMAFMWLLPGHRLVFNGTLNQWPRRLAHHTQEILPSTYNELFFLPQWQINLAQVAGALRPTLASCDFLSPGAIRGTAQNGEQCFDCVFNMSQKDLEISEKMPGEGLLHHTITPGRLAPGQAELWLSL